MKNPTTAVLATKLGMSYVVAFFTATVAYEYVLKLDEFPGAQKRAIRFGAVAVYIALAQYVIYLAGVAPSSVSAVAIVCVVAVVLRMVYDNFAASDESGEDEDEDESKDESEDESEGEANSAIYSAIFTLTVYILTTELVGRV